LGSLIFSYNFCILDALTSNVVTGSDYTILENYQLAKKCCAEDQTQHGKSSVAVTLLDS
jgi:hypothetical protein